MLFSLTYNTFLKYDHKCSNQKIRAPHGHGHKNIHDVYNIKKKFVSFFYFINVSRNGTLLAPIFQILVSKKKIFIEHCKFKYRPDVDYQLLCYIHYLKYIT